MPERPKRPSFAATAASRGIWIGAASGCAVLVLALVVVATTGHLPPGADVARALAALHRAQPLLAFIDAAPIVGAILGHVIGTRYDHIARLDRALVTEAQNRYVAARAFSESESRYRSVLESMHEVLFEIDLEGRWTFLSPAWAVVTGFSPDESVGCPFIEFTHLDDRAGLIAATAPLLRREATHCRLELRCLTAWGGLRWVEVRARLRVDESGAATGTFGTLQDVTERRDAATKAVDVIRRSAAQYRVLFDRSPLPMWVCDPADGRIVAANEAAWTHYGYTRDEFVALATDDLRDRFDVADSVAEPPDQGTLCSVARHRTKSGAAIDVEVAAQWMELDGRRVRLVVVRDVTAERRAEAERRASEARLRAIFDHAAVGIALHDGDGYFVEANPAMQRLFGYSVDELQAMRATDLAAPNEILSGRPNGTLEKRFVRKDGSELLGEITLSRIQATGISGMVAMIQDVTERRRLEAELAHSARHDVLTGLANRALLRERAAAALDVSNERRDAVALLFIDLDDFKTVNDSLGHAEGDRLLREVARRLGEVTRGTDTVARLGGDEFAILLEDAATPDRALDAAEHVLTALRRPVALQGAEVVVGGSIGVARAADSEGVDALLRNADVAMYRAKQIGKGTAELFAAEMHSAAVDRLELEADLRSALAAGDLRVAYQPIVDLSTRRAVGVECLVRWLHPVRGPVSPGLFVPLAEQTGLIVQLGRHVLREACRQGARWLAIAHGRDRGVPNGEPPFTITVNISSRQLLSDQLLVDVAEAIADTGFDPRCLVLEITESIVMQRIEEALERLHALKALGVRLAIDDFGTGYSSLAYLQRFPIDIIKLDKTFVDGVTRGARDAALVRTIIALGEMLGLRCIAEGVETAEQRAHLESLGCAYGQGFLFAPALPPGDAEVLLGLAPTLPRGMTPHASMRVLA